MGETIHPNHGRRNDGTVVGNEPTGFMGRIFLNPVQLSITQGPQFWVNVGYQHWQLEISQREYYPGQNYILPQWVESMEVAVSKEAYDALMKDLKEHFDQSPSCLSVAYRHCPDLHVCAPCAHDHFHLEMNAILARHAHRFPAGVGVGWAALSQTVGDVPGEQAVDQNGQELVHSWNPRVRTWPPLGYSIILQIPRGSGDRARAAWPPAAAPPGNRQGAAAAIPEPLTIPPAVNSKSFTLHPEP